LRPFFGLIRRYLAQCFRHFFDTGELRPQVYNLANFAKGEFPMSTMNISLPDALKTFVDDQVSGRGYSTSSEYVRELIRKDQDRQHLRGLLMAGAESAPTAPVNGSYFESLRSRVRKAQG
jgi:antitoxin ParD1/3/4